MINTWKAPTRARPERLPVSGPLSGPEPELSHPPDLPAPSWPGTHLDASKNQTRQHSTHFILIPLSNTFCIQHISMCAVEPAHPEVLSLARCCVGGRSFQTQHRRGNKRFSNKERQDNKRLFKGRGHLNDTNPFIFTEALQGVHDARTLEMMQINAHCV